MHDTTSVFPEYLDAVAETGNYLDQPGRLIIKSSGLTRRRVVFRLPLLLAYRLRSRKSDGASVPEKSASERFPEARRERERGGSRNPRHARFIWEGAIWWTNRDVESDDSSLRSSSPPAAPP